jgi:RimJ/RimL family protein N-acetyltransferase
MSKRQLSNATVRRLPTCLVPPRSAIHGRHVRLEPLSPDSHAAALYAVSHGDPVTEELWHYLPYGPFADASAFDSWVRSCAAGLDPIFYTIHDLSADAPRGMASFLRIDAAVGSVEIGHIWFAPTLQRRRQATEALYLMMHLSLEELGYRRLEWKCDALNTASRRAALRLGFRFEGVFYQCRISKGRNRDTAWYSLLDHEWPQARQHLQQWLADDNFDDAGRQRQSLGTLNQVESQLRDEPQ